MLAKSLDGVLGSGVHLRGDIREAHMKATETCIASEWSLQPRFRVRESGRCVRLQAIGSIQWPEDKALQLWHSLPLTGRGAGMGCSSLGMNRAFRFPKDIRLERSDTSRSVAALRTR
jgi:hypothetical protein